MQHVSEISKLIFHNMTNWPILQSALEVGLRKGWYNFWNFQKLQHITFDALI